MAYSKQSLANVVIDIETRRLPLPAADVEKIRAKFMAQRPTREAYEKAYVPHKTLKDPAKVAARYAEYQDKFELALQESDEKLQKALEEKDEKTAFRLDRNEMISVSLGQVYGGDVQDVVCYFDEPPEELAKKVVNYVDDVGPYRFIGFNHLSFDLPILGKHMAQAGVGPKHRIGKWDSVDLFLNPFAKSIGLKEAARAFGLKTMDINGSDVEELYRKGDWAKIAEYNASDVKLTGRLFVLASLLHDL